MTQNNIFPRNVLSPLIWTTRRSSTNFRIILPSKFLSSIYLKFPETSDGNIQAKIKRIFPPTHFWPTSDPSRYYKYVGIVDQKLTSPASLAEDLREKEEKKGKYLIPRKFQIPLHFHDRHHSIIPRQIKFSTTERRRGSGSARIRSTSRSRMKQEVRRAVTHEIRYSSWFHRETYSTARDPA